MYRKGLLFILLSLLISTSLAAAQQCAPQNLNNLVLAKWGGMWQDKKVMGYYRVLVYRTGWEHTQDIIQFQVMEQDEKRQLFLLKHCAQITESGSQPLMVQAITAINDRGNKFAHVRIRVLVGSFPGREKFQVYILHSNGTVHRKKTYFKNN